MHASGKRVVLNVEELLFFAFMILAKKKMLYILVNLLM